MRATMIQLLSSGEFCKMRYDTIPLKSASVNVSFYTKTQKCQILSCDSLVASELNIFFLLALQPQLEVVFYSPLAGFSLLAYEVS